MIRIGGNCVRVSRFGRCTREVLLGSRPIGIPGTARTGIRVGCCVAGRGLDDAGDEFVGHDLSASSFVTGCLGAVGVPGQRGMHGDALRHRQERGHVGHQVRCGPDADPSLGHRFAVPLHPRLRIQALPDPRGGPSGLLVTQLAEPAGEFGVHHAAVFHGEARGFPDHQGRAPFADLTVLQSLEGVRHFLDHRSGEPDVPVPADRGVFPCQRDLRGDAAPDLVGIPFGRGRCLQLGGGEAVGHSRLPRRARGFQSFQLSDFIDVRRIGTVHIAVGKPVDECGDVRRGQPRTRSLHRIRGRRHVFDSIL